MYCILTALTTVGYGDIQAKSLKEIIFQIIILAIGVICYSYVLSKLGDYVKIRSRAAMKFSENLKVLEEIRIAYPKIPFKLYKKILSHLQIRKNQQKKCDINISIYYF